MREGRTAMFSRNDTEPAIVFVDSPWSVQTLDRAIFDRYPSRKIIVIDEGQPTDPYFSDDDLIIATSLKSAPDLDDVHRRIAAEYRVLAVLGFSETSVFAAACLAEAFGVAGIGVDVALKCRDKHRMIEALSGAGVSTPRYFVADGTRDPVAEIDAIGGYPVVCKPLMGFAGCGVIRADDDDALNAAIRKIRLGNRFILDRFHDGGGSTDRVLVQSFIAGDEVAVDGYVRDGEAHVVAVIDKPDVSNGPYFSDRTHVLPSAIAPDTENALRRLAADSVSALGLDDSPFHLEARISDGGVHVLEIGARIGFMRSVHDAFGIDLCAIAVALKMGEPPDVRPRRRRYAGNYCVTAEKLGHFTGISNLAHIKKDPRIVDVPVFVAPGARVAPPPEGNSYIGYVLAAADSYADVAAALARAAREIDVVVD
jgi:biotin carboxylase